MPEGREIGIEGQPAHDSLDWRLFVALRTRAHPRALELPAIWFTLSGTHGIFWEVLAAAMWLGGASRGLETFIATTVFVYVSLTCNYLIKVILGRRRPAPRDPALKPLVKPPSSKSFPSSHAAMSFAAACALTFLHPQLFAAFFALALLMSWSRVYVGVHYPSDVVAGTAVGLALGAAGVLILTRF